jgi:hypothetical protein
MDTPLENSSPRPRFTPDRVEGWAKYAEALAPGSSSARGEPRGRAVVMARTELDYPVRVKYAYTYIRQNQRVFRYDNAPHHPESE